MARSDRARVLSAQLTGSATALRDLLVRQPHRYNTVRQAWPDLAERIDALVKLVEPPSRPSL